MILRIMSGLVALMVGATGVFFLTRDTGVAADVATAYQAPAFTGITQWINSSPLTISGLKGKVVLVDFWTYSCINCQRTLPYLVSWHKAYADKGLVIVGVHAPEFDFEKEAANVIDAAKKASITYPIALDNNFRTWSAYKNRFWPAKYLIDATGKVRYTHFGEGRYAETEAKIKELLAEAGANVTGTKATPNGVPTDKVTSKQTHETYLGYARAKNFVNLSEKKNGKNVLYSGAKTLKSGEWALSGRWTIYDQVAVSSATGAILSLNFSAKTANLVLGYADGKKTATCTVKIDGKLASATNGAGKDVRGGKVTVKGSRHYNLVSLPSFATGKRLDLSCDYGVGAYAFTFGS